LARLFSRIRDSIVRRRVKNSSSNNFVELNAQKIKDLEKMMNVSLNHKHYYVQALTHRSTLEITEFESISNERLEFLGDSVLSLIVAQYLFENFPNENEGFMTKIRANFVNRNSLGSVAKRLNLGDFIIISDNLERDFVKTSQAVLADAFEALIGALYLDQGLNACRKFIYKVLIEPNVKDDDYLVDVNYKSQLLEYTQAEKISSPVYEIVREEGPQHERIFTVSVSVNSEKLGIGKGKNKKTAEQNAARNALKTIKDNN